MSELPWLERVVAGLVIRGPGSEFVLGDLQESYAEDLRSGLPPRRARARVRRAVLGSCLAWTRHRVQRGVRPGPPEPTPGAGPPGSDGFVPSGERMSVWWQDLRVGARSLARRPGFAVGVALTLGLGIGATTAIFSVVDGVVLRPLPYEAAGRIVAVGTTFPNREWADEPGGLQHLAGISMANFRDFGERTRTLEAVAALEATNVLLPDWGDGPELVPAARVSVSFFELLGVSPGLGRTFLAGEARVGAESVALITHGTWQRRFGGDPNVIGRSLHESDRAATIVGVLPASFRPPEAFVRNPPEFWMPLQPGHERYADRGMRSLAVLGRLSAGTTLAEARAEAQAIATQLAADYPDGNVYPDGSYFGIGVNDLLRETVGTTGKTLRVFVGAAMLLLLLATTNSATLLLGRSLDRVREIDVRFALGAARASVVRLLLAEAVLISLAGALVGLAFGYGGVAAFERFAPRSIPRLDEIGVDGRVMTVTLLVSLGAGLLAGMLPAIRLTRRGGGTGSGPGGRTVAGEGSRLRSVLVAAQVATALVLLSGGGLLVASFSRIVSVDPGFDPEGVVSMNIALKRPDAPDVPAWRDWDAALAEVAVVPGLTGLAGTTNPPFQSPYWAPRVLLPDDEEDVRREGIAGYAITPGYLETIGTRVLAGRGFTTADGPDDEKVLLVNEAFVRTQLEGREPLGLRVRHAEGDVPTEMRIVGVVEDVVQASADEGPLPAVYFPHTQVDWPLVQVVVRSDTPSELLIPELRKAAARFSPAVPPRDVRTMRDRMAASRVSQRFQAMLVASLAVTALLLASLGLYGSLAHAVGRRRRELGVRVALGARTAGVVSLVVGQGLRMVISGLAVGLIASLYTNRLLSGLLFGTDPNDPFTLAAVSTLLLGVALVACLVPARRATAFDPAEVLRAE